jgi:hypothetical protein
MYAGGESYAGDGVLCKGLYDRLWQLFDERVGVANQGEPFRATTHRSLTGRSNMNVDEAGEYYCVACPFCFDTRKRLWINHMFGQPGQDGWPMKFLAICYNEHCLDRADNRSQLYEMIYGLRNVDARRNGPVFGVRETEYDDSTPLSEASPPGLVLQVADLLESNPDHPAVRYMVYDRGYTPDMLRQWGVGYCSSATQRFHTAQNRIIFPIWFNQKYVGWQGRYTGELSDWRSVPKYYTMPGLKKQRILCNFDRAVRESCGVLVEGLTDTHNVGAAGMATLGSSVSQLQCQLLAMHFSGKPIILLYDPEAEIEIDQAMTRLMQSCVNSPVIDVRLPMGTDPGSLAHDVIWSHIIQQAGNRGVRVTKCAMF